MHNPPAAEAAPAGEVGSYARQAVGGGDVGADVPASRGRLTLDSIASQDGVTSTIWVTENNTLSNWLFGDTYDLAFGAKVQVEGGFPAEEPIVNAGTGGVQSYGGFRQDPDSPYADGINYDAGGADSANRPRPASDHNGGVVVAGFCDGRASTLSDTMDRGVYLKLLSSGGSSLTVSRATGGINAGLSYQAPVNDSDYAR